MTKINANTQKILYSGVQTQQSLANTAQENLLHKDTPGYVAVDGYVIGKMTNGSLSGVTTSAHKQRINENLISDIRVQDSVVSGLESMETYHNKIMSLFGERDAANSFAHIGGEMSKALITYKKNPTDINSAQDALNGMSSHVDSITQLSLKIKNLLSDIEKDIGTVVNDANDAINDIAKANIDIKQAEPSSNTAFAYENQRRDSLQALSEQLGIKVIPFNGNQNEISDVNGNLLLQGSQTSKLSYDPTSRTPLTLTTLDGRTRNLSSSIAMGDPNGRLAGLMKLHESVLPGLQQQLDEYTKVMRDSFNEIHNLGISQTPPTTLTGTIGIPGQSLIDGSTVISGSGTIRIGAVNSDTGVLSGSIDIELSNNMTIQDLIDKINVSTENSNVPDSDVTASLTADGRLQLESSANSGVVIGSVGPAASLSLGDTYNSNISTNFSHFFGLNNLFTTGDKSFGGSTAGISSSLALRSDIKSSFGSAISLGTLSNTPTPPTTSVLLPSDVTTLSALSDLYSNSKELFNSTNISHSVKSTLSAYADSMIKLQKDHTTKNADNLKSEKSIYERMSKQASDISSVDEMQTLQDMLNINTSISFLIKAISIANKMQQDLLQIVT